MSSPLIIRPRAESVEGQPILRPLPSAQCRSVGPFVFFDHMLETDYAPGSGMDIRQHLHIGLSTLTYLFEGEILHKDSLGSDQRVLPGDVSWMTAGRGVAHVERTPAEGFANGSRLHGLQVWLASPREHEQGLASYSHHPAASLPVSEALGVRICLIAGNGFCLESPVPVLSLPCTPMCACNRRQPCWCRASMPSGRCTCSMASCSSMGRRSSRAACWCCRRVKR